MAKPGNELMPRRPRFAEPAKFVPIIFVCFVISSLYSIYMKCHVMPLLQWSHSPEHVNKALRSTGWVQLIVFNCLTTMIIICYLRSVLQHPGEVPDNEQWECLPGSEGNETGLNLNLQEAKKSGDRRYCKWCGKYKPDRCHHCRICRLCILKMDHHCPWIYNCVGFMNYKYFYLLLFYSGLTLHFIFWTMLDDTKRIILGGIEYPFAYMFLVFFGQCLCMFFMVLVTAFFTFHCWLICKALTTIEFCEKSMPKDGKSRMEVDNSVYDLGVAGNFRAVLGSNVFFALLPVPTTLGDGLSYVSDETRLCKDLGGTKGIRKKGHRTVQRARDHANMSAYGSLTSGRGGVESSRY